MKLSFLYPFALAFALTTTLGACSSSDGEEFSQEDLDDGDTYAEGPLGKADNANCNVTELRKCLDYGGGDACYSKWQCEPGDENGTSSPDISGSYDPVLGDNLARAARNGSQGYSAGRCYEFVWIALRNVLGHQIESLPIPATSAYQFGEWILANPTTARTRLRLVHTTMPATSAPRGSVIVWPRGVCGFNPTHGHIEIAQGDGTACSDYCGSIRTCTAQVFLPVR